MDFNYYKVEQVLANIEIDNIGSVALEAYNDEYKGYVLIIETNDGFSTIFEYGPFIVDMNNLPSSVACSINSMPYDDRKLYKIINDFLNKPKRNITQAIIVDKEKALSNCSGISNYIQQR